MLVARRSRPSPTYAWMVAGLAALLLACGLAPAARAHSQLVSSTPADGSSVSTLPAETVLTFNEVINPNFAQVVVSGVDGEPRTVAPTVDGANVRAPLPKDVPAGRIAVRFKVVSKDGHPIEGEITFTLSGAAAGGTSSSGAGASAGSATPRPAASATGERAAAKDDGSNIAVYALTGFAALALLGVGLMLLRWERQRNAAPPPSDPDR